MRTFLTLLGCMLLSSFCHGQIFIEPAEGTHSMIYPGGAVGFDVTDTKLRFSYNNLYRFSLDPVTGVRKNRFIGGVAEGETKEKLLPLYRDGAFNTSGKLGIIIGNSYDWFQRGSYFEGARNAWKEVSDASRTNKTLSDIYNKLVINAIEPQIASLYAEHILPLPVWQDEKDRAKEYLRNEVPNVFLDPGISSMEHRLLVWKTRIGGTKFSEEVKKALLSAGFQQDLVSFHTDLYAKSENEWKAAADKALEARANFDAIIADLEFWKASYYIRASMEATDAKTLASAQMPFDSIKKEVLFSPLIGIGGNIHRGNNWSIGALLSFQRKNNLAGLPSQEITRTTTIRPVNTPDTLVQYVTERKEKVQLGTPKSYWERSLRLDVIRYYSTSAYDDKKSANIGLNGYYVSRYSKEEERKHDVGITSYYFSGGRFIGGIYLELQDIGDDEYIFLTEEFLKEKLQFGIVAKFSLHSINNIMGFVRERAAAAAKKHVE